MEGTNTVPPEVDLETLRDARVVPVAQAVLVDMAGEIASTDVNADTDFTSVLVKVIQHALAADLNLTTENPYLFQLILGAYGAFSTVVQKCKVADAQDLRYGNIGREMMGLLAGANVPMGTKITSDEQIKALEVIQPQLEAVFARENLTWLEVKYILEGLFRSLKATEQLYTNNIGRSVDRMECKILGIEDKTDLSMKKLDATLQADMAEAQKVVE